MVMCVHEPYLPPSAVRAEDVRASEAPGRPSLHWQCHVVSPHMLVWSGGWRGHSYMGSLCLFPVAFDSCLPALCAAVISFKPLWLASFSLSVSVDG